MEKYLIIKAQEKMREWYPEENWEDTPVTLCKDWKKWYKENADKIDYTFEVWEFKEGKFTCVKTAEDILEKGMALYYWTDDQKDYEKPHIVYKYPNATRDSKIPEECLSFMKKGTDLDNCLKEYGFIIFAIGNNDYLYGEYEDNYYVLGY